MTTDASVDAIDISRPLREICDLLGLVYTNVLEINFRPGDLTATVAEINEHGSKYINDDGDIAKTEACFKVRS